MKHVVTILVALILVVLVTDTLSAQSVSSASQTVTFAVQRAVRVTTLADASSASTKSLKVTVGSDEQSTESDVVASSAAIRFASSTIVPGGNSARVMFDEDKQGKTFASRSPLTYAPPVGKSVITVTE